MVKEASVLEGTFPHQVLSAVDTALVSGTASTHRDTKTFQGGKSADIRATQPSQDAAEAWVLTVRFRPCSCIT